MQKNVAGQKIGCQMVSATDGSAFTGSVTVLVTGDAGTQATGSVGSGACTHEGNGYHTYAPAQAETNYDLAAFTFTGTGAIPATVQVFTTALGFNTLTTATIATGVWQDAVGGDFTAASSIGKSLYTTGAVPGAANGLLIAGSNAATTFSGLTTGALSCTTLTASGAVAFQSTFAVTTSTSLGAFSCTTLTASGAVAFQNTFATTGTTTFNAFTVTNALTVSGTTTLTGAITGASASNDLRINGLVPGAAGGLFIAGTNAATTVTASFTTTFTGNLTGNVVGSVASVTAVSIGAITTASFAAGAINAAAIASDAITDAKVASDVTIASVTGAVGSVTGDVAGKVLGGGAGTITATGAWVLNAAGAALAPEATALSTATWTGTLATNLATLASHDPGTTIGTSTYAGGAVASVTAGVSLATNAITTTSIQDGAITDAKITLPTEATGTPSTLMQLVMWLAGMLGWRKVV